MKLMGRAVGIASGVRVGKGVPSRAGVDVEKRNPGGVTKNRGGVGTIAGMDGLLVATGDRAGTGVALGGTNARGVGEAVRAGAGDGAPAAADVPPGVAGGLAAAAGEEIVIWPVGDASMLVPVTTPGNADWSACREMTVSIAATSPPTTISTPITVTIGRRRRTGVDAATAPVAPDHQDGRASG
jgi:hypothetical protein